MLEIIKSYPLVFVLTVIFPLGGGVVGAYLGIDALKSRLSDDRHKTKIEQSLDNIDEKMQPLSNQISTIQRYEAALSEYDQKDAVLTSVLKQYQKMYASLESFQTMQTSKKELEKGELADNILEVITSNLMPIKESNQLPSQPLVIMLDINKYKVIFAVPMRRTPDINFGQLPEGVTSDITDASKFGFTVEFKGVTGIFDPFGVVSNPNL